jgi:hypothetical protein
MAMILPIIHDLIFWLLRPLTARFGAWELPVRHRDMTADDTFFVTGLAKPGDLLLAYKWGVASNLGIPGKWKHAAMVGQNGATVIEAIAAGVRETDLHDWCLDHDRVALLSPLFADGVEGILAAGFAKTLIGQPYDESFEFHEIRTKNAGFYCSKVVWWCWDQVMLASHKKSPFHPELVLGVPTETPQDLANEKSDWRITWVKGTL